MRHQATMIGAVGKGGDRSGMGSLQIELHVTRSGKELCKVQLDGRVDSGQADEVLCAASLSGENFTHRCSWW